jgi:hypothetical protein
MGLEALESRNSKGRHKYGPSMGLYAMTTSHVENAGSVAELPGQTRPASTRLPIEIHIEADSAISHGHLAEATDEALMYIIKRYSEVDTSVRCMCEDEVVANGLDFQNRVANNCMGKLKDGKHLHITIAYGYQGNKSYASLTWAELVEPRE